MSAQDTTESIDKNKLFSISDSLISYYQLDSIATRRIILGTDITDNSASLSIKNPLVHCSDYLIYSPVFRSTMDTNEYSLLMSKKQAVFEDYLYFLQDNDISESLYKIYITCSNRIYKIERLGIDINVNFGNVLSASFFDESDHLKLFINYECYERTKETTIKVFNFINKKITLEKMILISGEKVEIINGEKQ